MDKKQTKKTLVLSIALIVSLIAVVIMGYMLIDLSNKQKNTTPQWQQAAISEEQATKDTGYNPKFMQLAITMAKENTKGGPIAAVIVKDGKIIASAANENKVNELSYEHAEICAIRNALKALGTKELDGCVLYTSAQPCLMCESAIAGSKIAMIYYAATLDDMNYYGWDDITEYEKIRKGENLIKSYAIDVSNKLEPIEKRKGKVK